jgi:beta-galactosidase
MVDNLKRYVRGGGLLIAGPRAGLKDWHNVFCSDVPPACGLAELLGTTVKPMPFRLGRAEMPKKRAKLLDDAPFAPGETLHSAGLFDNLEQPAQAQAIACHEDGEVAITLNAYGEGLAMYVACQPEESFHTCLIEWLVSAGKIEPVPETDADVEVTLRAGGGHRLIFVLNHNAEPVQIALEKGYHELITDRPVSGILTVEEQGVCILSEG